ncbi:hypothetical protein [Nannocystis exedens]|nr:hypothetical protein [Nannocystis exedens]
MSSVFRNLWIGAVVVVGGCHQEGDSAVLRFITSSGGDESVDEGGDEGGEKGGGGDSVCGYRTQTQGGWSSTCSGDNPGCTRDEYFDHVFPGPDHLVIGCGSNTATFINSVAVREALPAGGQARALTKDEMTHFDGEDDPQLGTVLAGQALALSLNVGFSWVEAFVAQDLPPFASLLIADKHSPCHGMSVQEALDEVNAALGDCGSILTPEEANTCATRINESLVDGEPECSTWYRFPLDSRLPLTVVPSSDLEDQRDRRSGAPALRAAAR